SNGERSKDESAVGDDDPVPSTSWGSMFQPPKREAEIDEGAEETDKFSELGGFEDFSLKSGGPAEDPVEKAVKEPLAPLGFEKPASGFEKPKGDPVDAPEPESVVEPEFEPEPKLEVKPEPKPESVQDAKPAPTDYRRSE